MTKPDQVYTTFIRTSPEKLWEAITNPEFTRQYWAGNANISDWKKGSKWEHSGETGTVHVFGTVEEVIPLKRLVLSWVNPSDLNDVSRVTFEMIPLNDTVQLNVVHGDFQVGSSMPDSVSKGWPKVLSGMKSYLESGIGLNIWRDTGGNSLQCAG